MTLKKKYEDLLSKHSALSEELSKMTNANERLLKKHLDLQGDYIRALEDMRKLARKCLSAEEKYAALVHRYTSFLDDLANQGELKTEGKET